MTFKFRIIHKGLTLIALPLFLGIAFVLLLSNGLSDFDRRIRHELLLKDAMIRIDGITRKIFAARVCAAAYFASKDQSDKESFHQRVLEANNSYKILCKQLKNEPGLDEQLSQLKQEILMGNRFSHLLVSTDVPNLNIKTMFGSKGLKSFLTNRPAYSLMEALRNSAARDALATIESMKKLQEIFIGGICISVLVTLALAVYVSRNISSRLLQIVDNTVRLSKKMPLQKPLKGNDEIAELDHFLFTSASEIRELEQFKEELISIVSHELKSPLSALDGFLSAFSHGLFGELNKKAQSSVERAHKSVRRLMELVTELLDLDRLEAGQLEMTQEQFSVAELVTTAVDAVRELSEQSGVAIEVQNPDVVFTADRNRLVQVIVNFLSNAIKFSPPGSTVSVKLTLLEGMLECRVSDQGRGIPESFRKEIFEPFKQVETKDGVTKKGTGLGLTISRSIIEQHNGKIGVDSEEGKGSTFWFKIPLPNQNRGDVNQKAALRESSQTQVLDANSTAVTVRAQSPIGAGSFGILQKGLILVALPLLFQLGFISVTGFLFYQIQEQVQREEHSKEIVDSLNRVAEKAGLAINSAMMYLASEDPDSLKEYEESKQDAMRLFEHVKELSLGDVEQQENIKEMHRWLDKSMQLVEQMTKTRETEIQALLEQSNFVEQSKPLQESQTAQENLLNRERSKGKKLAATRARMILDTKTALMSGIVLNIILSTLLVVLLMRDVSRRLSHVMSNTARLVKREELDPPIEGSDEIAYLDRIFYQAGKHLIELETFKHELISIVSHELRTPLMSIYASLELLSAGALGELSDKAKSRLKIAESETNRLIRLINNLLDIEKMSAGKFLLEESEISIAELLDLSTAAIAELTVPAGIKLEVSAAEGNIRVDRDRFSQILINLLSNAIKFSPAGGTVRLEVERSSSQIQFRVIDQGRGIPAEMKDRIFERFVQVDKKDASERGGSGLGLALAKSMVEQHGGTIGVESEPDAGSVFWIKLPRDR